MTFNLKVSSQSGEYKISSNLAGVQDKKNIFVLYDDYFSEDFINKILPNSQKISIKISENNKNLRTVDLLIEAMTLAECNKQTHLVAVGGGATQDLATLVASLYMRGISWSYIPTTLMSMLDSCIGGKSSINVKNYKNILGNFYPPEFIYIESKFANTLPKIAIASGLAEAGKICYAKSNETFNQFQNALKSVSTDMMKYEKLAEISLTAKKWFIEIDEFDRKERKMLNFGHTFGHALEAASNFKIPHGIAILIGMKVAISFTGLRIEKLENFIIETFNSIKQDMGIISIDKNSFKNAISKDKKNSSMQMFFILPNNNGELALVGFEQSTELLEKCWDSLIYSLKDMDAIYEVF